LGYLTDDEILKVIEGVDELKNSSPFYLEINQISYAPERKNPSMIWAKVKKTKELIDLKDRLDRILNKSIGFVPEGHYLPHLTLGRIKKWDFRKIEPEDRPEIENEVSFKFLVNSIEIMESNLKKGGAEYFVVKSIPFSK
jgi:2'-5' RNA ligase